VHFEINVKAQQKLAEAQLQVAIGAKVVETSKVQEIEMRVIQAMSIRRKLTLISMAITSVVLLLACLALARLRPGYNAAAEPKSCNPSGCVPEQHGSFDLRDAQAATEVLSALKAEPQHYGGLHLYQERTTICPLCARSCHLAPVSAVPQQDGSYFVDDHLIQFRRFSSLVIRWARSTSLPTGRIACPLRASVVVITLVLLVLPPLLSY